MARISKHVREALDASGQPWSVDPGKRHLKIVVGGKLVGILPRDGRSSNYRDELNLIAQIKRAARTTNANGDRT